MDLSKLSSNDKLAALGAVLAIVGAFLSFGGGGSFGVLTGIAMLIIIFLPQFSPSTNLPGSKGSLMLIVGGVAGIGAILALLGILAVLGAFGAYGGTWFIGLLLGVAGGLLMGWASWKEFQSEGGKFNVGMASTPPAPPAPPAQTYTPPPAPPAQSYTPPPAPPVQSYTPPPAPAAPAEPMGGEHRSEDDPQA